MHTRRVSLLLLFVLAAFTAVQLTLWSTHPGPVGASVDNDLARYAAAAATWRDVFTVQGFSPLGYPLLLRCTTTFVDDPLVAGRALSLLASLGSLLLVHGLVRRGVGPTWAGLATVMLGFHGYFHETALLTGPAAIAGFLTLAAGALVVAWIDRPTTASAIGAGGVFGALALVRADALLPVAIATLGLAACVRRPGRWWLPLAAAVAFAPQVALSLHQHGVWLYSTQAKNVWFGIHGGMHWEGTWNQMPETVTLREVIAAEPGLFVRHWAGESANAVRRLAWMIAGIPPVYLLRVVAPRLLVAVAAAVACGGAVVVAAIVRLRRDRPRLGGGRSVAGIAAVALIAWVLSVSAVFSVHRVLVPVWLVLVVGLFVALGRIAREPAPRARWWLAAALVAWYAPAAIVHVHTMLRYAALRGATP